MPVNRQISVCFVQITCFFIINFTNFEILTLFASMASTFFYVKPDKSTGERDGVIYYVYKSYQPVCYSQTGVTTGITIGPQY